MIEDALRGLACSTLEGMDVDIHAREDTDGILQSFDFVVACVLGETGFDDDNLDRAAGLVASFRKRKESPCQARTKWRIDRKV